MTAGSVLTWLLETSLAVSLLILIIMIIRRPVALWLGSEATYLLWLAPVGRLFIPELKIIPGPEITIFEPSSNIFIPTEMSAISATNDVAGFTGVDFAAAILFIWALGAVTFLVWQFAVQKRFMQSVEATSEEAPDALIAEANVMAYHFGLKSEFDLRVMPDETGPLVIGLLKPVILVPRSFSTDYLPAERQMALAHEISHIARGDLRAAMAALVFRAAQWPNPIAHIAYKSFRTDQEAACDASVLSRHKSFREAPHAYATAIVKSARSNNALPACGLSIAHHLKERLMLMKKTKTRPIAGRIIAGALIIAGLGVSASYGYAADKKKDKQKDDDTKVEKSVIIKRAIHIDGDIDSDSTTERVVVFKNGHRLESDDSDIHIKVMKHDGKNSTVWVSKDKDGNGDFEFSTLEATKMLFFGDDGDAKLMMMENCNSGEGEAGPAFPAIIELLNEEGDDQDKFVSRTIICGADSDAGDPKKMAAALRKAIDKMETDAAKEAERRARTIAALREQLKKLETERKATKKEKK